MANNPVVNTLTFTGNVAGQATISAQGIAGGLTFLLPNTVPVQGQLIDVVSINGNNVFLGWVSPQSLSNIPLSDLAQSGATSGEFIAWNGTMWAPSSFVPGSGTVTSVALTAPVEFTVGGSPITTSGTLAISKATQSANTVWAGPTTGAAAAPTFRALVAADIGANTVTIAAINSKRGAGAFVQLALSGTAGVAGDVVTYDATGNTQDSGTLLSSLAPLASPTFTGTVTLPATVNSTNLGLNISDNSTQGIAITESGGGGVFIDGGSFGTRVNNAFTHNGTAKFNNAILDSTSSAGTSGQVLSSTVTGVQWVTDTESVTSVFTRTGAVTAQSGDYSVGQVTGAAPAANPTFTGTVTTTSIAPTSGNQLSLSALGAGSQIALNGLNSSQILVNSSGAISIAPAAGQITTVTGHISLEGVTSTGATGTGNIVFSASPTFTGTNTVANEHITGTLADGAASVGTSGQVLTSTVTGIAWANSFQSYGPTGDAIAAGDNHSVGATITLNGTTPVTVTLTGAAVYANNHGYVVMVTHFSGGGTLGELVVSNQSTTGFQVTSNNAADTGLAWFLCMPKPAAD